LTRQNMLISYAEDFVSYLLSEKYIANYEIRNIILYGSVTRGDYGEGSDIDIFMDVSKPKGLEEKIKGTVKEFYSSSWSAKWKGLGIKNRISVLVGNLDDWKDLKRSIVSNGIVLYGRYSTAIKGKPMALFSIESIKPESKRVFVNRKLFGYKRYNKRYAGLVEKYEGEKTGKGCFTVPLEHSKKVLAFFRKQKVTVRIREIVVL
jgi:predicted nucleotidyltransferase